MLSPDELKLLRSFQRRVKDLASSSLATKGPGLITLQIVGKAPGLSGIDLDHVFVFGITLRQFLLQADAVNFSRVCNLIDCHSNRPDLNEWVAHFRREWIAAWNEPMGIVIDKPATVRAGTTPLPPSPVDSKNYTAAEFFDLWLYSSKAHTNPTKEAILDAMPFMASELLLMRLVARLSYICYPLHMISEVIRLWLDDPTEVVPPAPVNP